ncbi:hypothetical protein OPT61_g9215 [Boeremia exigua]|uniref:Uncharacterized protein n=1 Tax=Boeremia exigua TaxID=749465 RepID=A0ACC2HVC2_9PLEO|nr:hypothetical protein OPT61_g9215 [Boeremia exigua]
MLLLTEQSVAARTTSKRRVLTFSRRLPVYVRRCAKDRRAERRRAMSATGPDCRRIDGCGALQRKLGDFGTASAQKTTKARPYAPPQRVLPQRQAGVSGAQGGALALGSSDQCFWVQEAQAGRAQERGTAKPGRIFDVVAGQRTRCARRRAPERPAAHHREAETGQADAVQEGQGSGKGLRSRHLVHHSHLLGPGAAAGDAPEDPLVLPLSEQQSHALGSQPEQPLR